MEKKEVKERKSRTPKNDFKVIIVDREVLSERFARAIESFLDERNITIESND